MKNFWLIRRRKKDFANRLNEIGDLVQDKVKQKLNMGIGTIGGKSWPRRSGTKTQP